MEDSSVGLHFNKQGLPTTKIKADEYYQGRNIRYWHPRNGRVARFGANADRANLNCNEDPSNSKSQKELALLYFKNEVYKPSDAETFPSVPTFAISYLLL